MSRGLKLLLAVATVLGTLFVVGIAGANHAWDGYHWSRPSNPFNVDLGDNLTTTGSGFNWSAYLATAAANWEVTSGACNNANNPIRTTVIAGNAKSRNCRPGTGVVEVCNASYGNNGWLGIATIYVSGTHITKGSVKVNDYYMESSPYNTADWHQYVMCQEVGHTFGLQHQDENFNNADLLDGCGRGTCMDYSNTVTNQTTPNQHDYDQLVTIYSSHLDGAALAAASPIGDEEDLNSPSAWGQAVRFANGRPIIFERRLGPDERLFTWVIWVPSE
jgi:hypothetical protein